MKNRLLIFISLVFLFEACSTSSKIENYLIPTNISNELIPCWKLKKLDELTHKDTYTICYESDTLKISFALASLPDLYVLKVSIRNKTNHSIEINMSDFNLLDTNMFQFRNLTADEVANSYASKVTGYPIYKPKVSDYSYKTTGTIDNNGNYTAKTSARTTYNAAAAELGNAIGNAIIANRNKKLLKFADKLYNEGMELFEIIPSGTGIRRNIYWARNENNQYPIYARFKDLRIQFTN